MTDGVYYVAWREDNRGGVPRIEYKRSDGKRFIMNIKEILPALKERARAFRRAEKL